MVKTLPSNAGGMGSIPGWGAKIPHASRPKNQNIKQKRYCNKFNKDFKNGPHQKTEQNKRRQEGSMFRICFVPKTVSKIPFADRGVSK